MAARDIKLLALDLDGTLLNSDHVLTPRTEHTLRAAMARGIEIVLATGKTYHSAAAPIRQLGLTTPGVYTQGLTLVDGSGEIFHEECLPVEAARRVLAYAEAQGINAVAYSREGILTAALGPHTDFLEAHHEPAPHAVGPLTAQVDRLPIHKVIFFAEPARIQQARGDLTGQVDGSATLVQSLDNALEILPPGTSKGGGLRRVLAKMGIDPAHVLACGDGENDVEMVQLAGIGVAMANADPRLKAVADHVTASNDADGVALAVEKFVLAE